MKKIIFASNNKNKTSQVKKVLTDFEVVSIKEAGLDIDVEESGSTCKENAKIKAKAIKNLLPNEIVISDDSGLYIDALDGWPGVLTHRFLGENATYHDRNMEILKRMQNIPYEKRDCSVVCDMCLIDNSGNMFFEQGEFRSKIAMEEKGGYIFGFDGIVEAQEGITIAQISEKEKIYFNARSLALKKLLPKLAELTKN